MATLIRVEKTAISYVPMIATVKESSSLHIMKAIAHKDI